jgi:superfamily II DNA or RNA helicase
LHDGIDLFDKNMNITIGYYLGGMKEEKLKESESKKIILATYAMASEGLDIKTLTTLVMATPKSDVCQSVGRILRSKHETPMVIDIVDNHTLFQNQYKKRCSYYKSKNYLVQHYETPHNYYNNEYEVIELKKRNAKKENQILNENGKEIKCLIKL